jgi:hypothetical protein
LVLLVLAHTIAGRGGSTLLGIGQGLRNRVGVCTLGVGA